MTQVTTYAEAIEFLNSLSRFGWRLGLERMNALCARLDHPETSCDTVHVAGTNGKGSTSTFIARILQANGIRTGLYTSPHLYDGRERIRVDGQPISEETAAALVAELEPHIQEVNRQHGPVTEFEAWTMVMLLHFRREGVKTAVIEAGLGGRWDSTNVAQPLLAVLTNISLDHTDRLGNTIAEIAHDKAGIIKPGGKLLCGPLTPEAAAEVIGEAKQTGAEVYRVLSEQDAVSVAPRPGADYYWEPAGASDLVLTDPRGERTPLHFAGPQYQGQNAALAASAACILRDHAGYAITAESLSAGLRDPIPGRFEVVAHSPEVILDAAHNTAAAAVLAAELARTPWDPADGDPPELRLVFGSSTGHDAEGCLRILAPLAVEVILTRAHNPRSRPPTELAETLEQMGVPYEIVPDVAAAVAVAIRRSGPRGRVCVTGSFFVLGEAPRAEAGAHE